MIEKKRVIAVIPARGGSKGIKDKNIRSLGGLPLIAHVIKAALGSRYLDRVVVTTDSAQIATVAKQQGADVPFLRPAALAQDTSKTVDAVAHTLDTLQMKGNNYDIVVLLQPTQPFTQTEHIDKALEAFIGDKSFSGMVGVCEVKEHPILMRTLENGRLNNLLKMSSTVRRQDMPAVYKVNGCIYINARDDYHQSALSLNDNPIPFIMDRRFCIDIDEESDLNFAQYLLDTGAVK